MLVVTHHRCSTDMSALRLSWVSFCHSCLFLHFVEVFLTGLGASQCVSEVCVYTYMSVCTSIPVFLALGLWVSCSFLGSRWLGAELWLGLARGDRCQQGEMWVGLSVLGPGDGRALPGPASPLWASEFQM